MPDKIHYQQFDSLGRVQKVLVDNDAKTATGKLQQHDKGQAKGIDQVLKYGYNLKGEQTLLERDNNVDGTYDYREAYTLDPNGQQKLKEIDLTNDGTFDKKEVYVKQPDGGLEQVTFYNLVNKNGKVEDVKTHIESYELDPNNHIEKVSSDTLGDGSINSVSKYDLDPAGNIEKAYFDTNGDSKIDRIETHTRTNGLVTRTEVHDSENKLQEIVTYEYLPSGQVSLKRVDTSGDKSIDKEYRYTYDNHDRETRREEYSYSPKEKKLALSAVHENTFDPNNNIVNYKITYSNGKSNENNYIIDDYGRIKEKTVSGINNFSSKNEYNTDNTVKTTTEYKPDGKFSVKNVFSEYDVLGNYTKVDRYYSENGEKTQTWSLIRDPNSGQIQHTIVDDTKTGDGADKFTFGTYGANQSFHFTQDLTTWSEEKLALLGASLKEIQLANNSISTLTLDANVVAKISEGGLKVNAGNDKNDILNLSGFEKATDGEKIKNYDLYTATVGSEKLNLYVQEGISVNPDIHSDLVVG
ncbi:hypothetical protein [Mannheimia sp. ZY171111]|uniref:hypothetical protein n=1 Tax=Mannheimia sp. ZY171111 TaxID=2679995 RepID=UPI001ADD8022|nr:hypothetical protein [Mannheimia sp. ZY171111]QTM01245.1 hypothetical protein GM698_06420 [Mannheimia sp. ZY171111]